MVYRLCCIPLLLLIFGAISAHPPKPNIVHIVADDLGWHDIGASNVNMHTPNIDSLIRGGISLTRFYAQKECAPSRSSIMTGRLPFKYGYYENPSDAGGVPLNYTMLPAVLRSHGYRTHAIGKWHCGFQTREHTPTYRGFDSFLGFWHWGEEYVDHAFPPYYKNAKCRGLDFTNASGPNLQPMPGLNGTLSTDIYVSEFARVVAQHSKAVPLYVYLAFQNAHDPYEHAPQELLGRHYKITNPTRRNFTAIVEDLDRGIGSVVQTLKEAGLWNNTVVWFNADNGGELPFIDQSQCNATCWTTACCGGAGSNHPLRGGKFGLFEGGIRVRAFVHSERIPEYRRGSSWPGLAHVSDIFATMASLAGASLTMRGNSKSLGTTVDEVFTDGYDLWNSIIAGSESPRIELVHQPLNIYWNKSCTVADLANPFVPSCGSAITVLPYKLFVGFPGDSRIVSWPVQGSQGFTRQSCTKSPCLFNIEEDPSESNDIGSTKPEIVSSLLNRLHQLSIPEAVPQPADAVTPDPPDAACAVVAETGAWLPWEDAGIRSFV